MIYDTVSRFAGSALTPCSEPVDTLRLEHSTALEVAVRDSKLGGECGATGAALNGRQTTVKFVSRPSERALGYEEYAKCLLQRIADTVDLPFDALVAEVAEMTR